MNSILVGTSALSALLLVAVMLTWLRNVPDRFDLRLQTLLQLAIATHCLHASEEFATGFYRQFPAFLGLEPWSGEFFVAFNLGWLAIWTLAGMALNNWRLPRPLRAAAWATIWFLALASCANALAHPLLALASASYFPGLWTSPLAGVVGYALARRLVLETRS